MTETWAAVVLVPLITRNEANRSQREHWTRVHRRAKDQRTVTYQWLRHLLPPVPPPLPLVVTVTRVAPGTLDPHDGLPAACKHVVDGIADYLSGQGYGQGQDHREGLTWQYAQRRGRPKEYSVEIVIEREQDARV